ncbi:hypothetical protein ACFVQB_18395 [Paenibacillus sp. NPDC057886]|uniref:hypothetical protein n=1 Tax=Paenibacillus sp. NPDC057886 TaxID=3346270 RepID=UPI00367B9BDF
MYFISRERIEQSGIADPLVAQRLIERTFWQKAQGTAVSAQEVAMAAGAREAGAFYSLPAYLAEEGVAGLKWTSHVPQPNHGLPYTHPVVLLNELATGRPLAILEGELISGLRTGAVSSTAIKILTGSHASSILLCGSGFQAGHQLRSILPFMPELKEVHVWSRTAQHAEQLLERHTAQLEQRGIHTRVHVSLPERLDFAEVVVGATSASEPYLHAEHFVRGHLYLHIGMRDIDSEAILSFDDIVCDDYEAGVPSSSQSLFGLARQSPDIARKVTLLETLLGKPDQAIQQHPERKIMFNAFGLSIFDLVLAHETLKRLLEQPGTNIAPLDLSKERTT